MSRKTQLFSVYQNDDVVSRERTVKRDKIPCCRKTRDSSNTRSPPERDKVSLLFSKKTKTARINSTPSAQHTTKQVHADGLLNTKEQPWGQILRSHTKQQSSFSHFDPLRTLHFLIKELESRIKNDIPGKLYIWREVMTNFLCVRFAFTGNCARHVICFKSGSSRSSIYYTFTSKFRKRRSTKRKT